jgi:hypothetical protein
MPSPFPGMDPYLEGSPWTGVHAELSVEIARQLSQRLSPRYVARTNERFVVTMSESEEGVAVSTAAIYPDAFVAERRSVTAATEGTSAAVAEAPRLRMATTMPETLRLLSIEIRDVEQRRLVTAIEVLSPVNKTGEGRTEYLAKRRRLLLSPSHLMEIDLLRRGERVPMRQQLPDYPYFVFLSRAESRPVTDIWPVGLRESLPVVPVPLLADDADVSLDLQAALTAVYDTFRYALTIDYAAPLANPFPEADAEWIEQCRRAGQRAAAAS